MTDRNQQSGDKPEVTQPGDGSAEAKRQAPVSDSPETIRDEQLDEVAGGAGGVRIRCY